MLKRTCTRAEQRFRKPRNATPGAPHDYFVVDSIDNGNVEMTPAQQKACVVVLSVTRAIEFPGNNQTLRLQWYGQCSRTPRITFDRTRATAESFWTSQCGKHVDSVLFKWSIASFLNFDRTAGSFALTGHTQTILKLKCDCDTSFESTLSTSSWRRR